MPRQKSGDKVVLVCEVQCPHCSKAVLVAKRIRVKAPAVPAEKEESYFAQKGTQTTL